MFTHAPSPPLLCGEAHTDETIHDAVKRWCEGGRARQEVVARFGEIGHWNVSGVTSMRDLFKGPKIFNEDISRWDTSNVTDMYCMFRNASSFDQPVERLDTSNVTSMSDMFALATSFKQTPSWYKE